MLKLTLPVANEVSWCSQLTAWQIAGITAVIALAVAGSESLKCEECTNEQQWTMAPNSGNVQVAAMEVFGRTSSAGIVRSRYQGRCRMQMKEHHESNCSHERNPRDKLIEACEMWKRRESNDKDILKLDMIKKQCQEEGRRGSGVGTDLAAVRNLSRRCSERGESVVDVQDPWAGQENTTCSLEDSVNPS